MRFATSDKAASDRRQIRGSVRAREGDRMCACGMSRTRGERRRTLSEHDSTALLRRFGVPFVARKQVATPDDAAAAASDLGFPVVVKLAGEGIAHKTERGLVRLE